MEQEVQQRSHCVPKRSKERQDIFSVPVLVNEASRKSAFPLSCLVCSHRCAWMSGCLDSELTYVVVLSQ